MRYTAGRKICATILAVLVVCGAFYRQQGGSYLALGMSAIGDSASLGDFGPSLGDSNITLGSSARSAPFVDGHYLVDNFTLLKELVEGTDSPVMIRLTKDIVMEKNIIVSEGKVLVIEGDGHSIDETPRGTHGDGYAGQGGNIFGCFKGSDVTLRNASITGYNYYGTFWGYGQQGMTLTFDGVTYTGPQVQENKFGKATFKDSTINIVDRSKDNTGSLAQEVLEASWIVLQGNVEINHLVNSPYIEDALFWMEYAHPALGGTRIEVLPDAVVKMTTESAFVHLAGISKKDLIIGARARVTLRACGLSGTGMGDAVGLFPQHSFTNTEIHENAFFSVEQFDNPRSAGGGLVNNKDYSRTLMLRGSFYMAPGSVFEMKSEYSANTYGGPGALMLRGITMTMENPKLFSVQGPVRALNSACEDVVWDVTGINTVNRWTEPVAYTSDTYNTLEDMPQHFWHTTGGSYLDQFNMQIAGTSLHTIINLICVQDKQTLLTYAALGIENAATKRFAWGDMAFTLDPVDVTKYAITGSIEAGSRYTGDVRAEYIDINYQTHTEQRTGQSGPFHIGVDPSNMILGGDSVSTLANVRGLKAKVGAVAEGSLLLKEVPEYLDYGDDNAVPTSTTVFPRVNQPTMRVVVQDSRTEKEDWKLMLKVVAPLQTKDGSSVLPDSLLVRGSHVEGGEKVISDQALEVYRRDYEGDPPRSVVEETISWGPHEGILVQVDSPAGVQQGVEYRATLQWTLGFTP